ncbi:hypothetical protein [Catenovulum maritimum]|uniref:Uncharacterized protein n=1 Tax=Catenovulum maritimum TaxID=1513271 RepID=A0A0J8GSV9_9ALTE|nr:hypothetical protein [Catenovulum maritimum]KMT65875.1 hypothetical protein XM47_06675 [Catenovulum maritimum]
MRVNQFIDLKAKQLVYYVRAFLVRTIDYSELDIFIWDTLEEWGQVTVSKNESYSEKERVFWHLVHQISFWEKETLLNDTLLINELNICVEYIDGNGCFPMDCIGIRP